MKDIVSWILLSRTYRTEKKMALLARDFEKKKGEVSLSDSDARVIFDDIERARGMGCDVITYIDSEYPDQLRHIAYPPPYLYLRGNRRLLNYPIKATIVGSREASGYGINVAMNFAMELAGNDVLVISGGARGIDSAAIKGALRAKGKVIAVVGTGIDVDYPKENKKLFEEIVSSGGLIVSEFPMGTGPFAQNFPVRNRVMTALGDCVVVVEAGERSGALISANHASEQGKTVFAVPGNIDSPNSMGANALIRDGAMMALSASDILFELMEHENEKFRKAREYETDEKETQSVPVQEHGKEVQPETRCLSELEAEVLNALKSGKNTYDEILQECTLEPNKLTSLLTIMEIKGIIKLAFGNRYKIID